MAQHRTTLAADGRLRVEKVVSHAAPAQWSTPYRPETRRLLWPGNATAELRNARGELFADPLTVFTLAAGEPYRMRHQAAPGERASFVVSELEDEGLASLQAGAAWLLAPLPLYRMRCHWRMLRAGRDGTAATEGLLAPVLAASAPAPWQESRAVRRVRETLAAEPGARLSLHELAEVACITGFHLARLFRAQLGMSVHEYRHRLRLAAALQSLEEGERDLAGLAHGLGYSSQSHFGAVFRAALGTTPALARSRLAE